MFKLSVVNIWIYIQKGLKTPLIRNFLIVGCISLLSSLVSFYKETLVASSFGLSELMDTYLIAILIPSIIQNVFIEALKKLFIPNYAIELKTTGQSGSFQTFVFLTVTILAFLLVVLAVVFVEFFLELVFSGHDQGFYDLIRSQFYIVLPCLFLWGYISFMAGILEMDDKFLISTIAKFITPTTIILCLFLLKSSLGDMVLVSALTLGSFLTFIYYLCMNLKFGTLRFKKFLINKNMIMMVKEYPPKVTSGLLTGINPFVDQFFAAQLVMGSITAISYGVKIPGFVVSILMMALGTVLLPHFSKSINDNLEEAYRELFKILIYIFFGSSFIIIFSFIFSSDIIRLIFEHDQFTPDDTVVVSKLQRIAFLYVPFYLCTLICVNFLTAINKNRFMALVSLWNLILNLVMNIVLMRYFDVYGLVMSTTVVYIVCSFLYVGYTYKQYKRSFGL
ncbi:murein biosynthesis integral membrane protein MurJ [Flagellimonas sp.]|uniref:murein biosynthesis integral membrane protein MurJ n=1 Tax=Flagellimonas sp. TaxID=2058762 RepID=UPI003BADBE64